MRSGFTFPVPVIGADDYFLGGVGLRFELSNLCPLGTEAWGSRVKRAKSFPGVSAKDAEVLKVAGEIDAEIQQVLCEQVKASQEKREREKPEEIDWGVQQVPCREIYPEGDAGSVSAVHSDRR